MSIFDPMLGYVAPPAITGGLTEVRSVAVGCLSCRHASYPKEPIIVRPLTQDEHYRAAGEVASWLIEHAVEVAGTYHNRTNFKPIGVDAEGRFVIEATEPEFDIQTNSSVKSAPEPSVSTVDVNETGSVSYDVDAAGKIVGIEALGVDHPERVDVAREFAARKGLTFPADLT